MKKEDIKYTPTISKKRRLLTAAIEKAQQADEAANCFLYYVNGGGYFGGRVRNAFDEVYSVLMELKDELAEDERMEKERRKRERELGISR